MKCSMVLLHLICLALALGACSRGERGAATTDPNAGSSVRADDAAGEEDPVEVALAIAAVLDRNPVNPATAIGELGHTTESFEVLMARIAVDPELSARYLAGRAAARR